MIEDWIIYEDDALLAVNKPEGLRTIADGYVATLPHLAGLVKAERPSILIVHRLDKDTSGLVLFAKTANAHRGLNQQFADHTVKKMYLAITCGAPQTDIWTMNQPLWVDGDRKHRTIVHASGKSALTQATVLKRSQFNAYLKVESATGYTHQIRAHLSHAGLPVLGDQLYAEIGKQHSEFLRSRYNFAQQGVDRLYLHAAEIRFIHPVSGHVTQLKAPLSRQFEKKAFVLFKKSSW